MEEHSEKLLKIMKAKKRNLVRVYPNWYTNRCNYCNNKLLSAAITCLLSFHYNLPLILYLEVKYPQLEANSFLL